MTSRQMLRQLILLLLLLSSPVLAQQPDAPLPPQTDEQRKAKQELEQKALMLLEDVVKDSESYKNAENRIRVRALAANVLWEHDEARARILFKEAMTSLADLLKDQDSVDNSDNPKMGDAPQRLRREFLQMLAQRDPKLARDFMRATRPQPTQSDDARSAMPDQTIEVGLAMQLIETDPKQALEMAEENLSRGLSYELPQLLLALREKDPQAAAKLASEVVTKLRAEKLDSSHIARQVAVSLLRDGAQTSEGEGGSSPPLLDQQTLRELADMLLTEALRPASTSPELLSSLHEMMPVVEKYAPARVAQLKRKAPPIATTPATFTSSEGETSEVPQNLGWDKYQPVYETGSVDELLEAAPKAPQGMREMLYQRAVEKLMAEGEVERARQVVTERVKDPGQRKEMLAQLDQMAAFKAAEQGKIEQTRKLLATLRTNEERLMLLAQLATGAAARGDKKVALQLLDEARGMMGARAKNFTQLGAQLTIARAYAPLDASRSLAILEPVVDQLNELLAAAVVLGGFMTEEFIKDDEIMMEPLAMISTEFIGSYASDVKALARADFDRTKALADRFLRDEIRTIARLLVAQSILSSHSLRPVTPKLIESSITMQETMKSP